MEKIIMVKGAGKTRELLKRSSENGFYIVCSSKNEAEKISRIAQERGLKIPFPITHDEFKAQRFCGRGIKGFLIDNADMLLQSMGGGVEVGAITMTGGEQPTSNPNLTPGLEARNEV